MFRKLLALITVAVFFQFCAVTTVTAAPAKSDPKSNTKTDWWSLKPIIRPPIPQFKSTSTLIRNPIDAFILAKLREKKLLQSPEADRRSLIRRLYFDLIGLPPPPEEIALFLADKDPQAYEKLVDRLLSTPQHGERWARHWLDVAHFGETHGYDKDKLRLNAWPYRDYVIRAFNQDKPWSRFIQEQIAGDTLFPETQDGIEALGFLAAGPWDFIGHAELPESKIDGKIARHLDRDDMVANTMVSFTSLTAGCAQCHDHKFDPISQEDYYSLQSVFAAIDRADKPYETDPAIAKRRAELVSRQQSLLVRQKALDIQLAKLGGKDLSELNQQILAAKKPAGIRPPQHGYHSAVEPTADKSKWVQVDLGRQVALDRIVLIGCHDDFNNIGDGFGFPSRFKIESSDDATFKTNIELLADHSTADFKNPGTAPVTLKTASKSGRFIRITATRLAPRKDDFIFALAEFQAIDTKGENAARGAIVTALDSIEAPIRWTKTNLTDNIFPGAPAGASDLAELEKRRRALIDKITDPAIQRELDELPQSNAVIQADLAKLPAQQVVFAGIVHHGSGNFVGTGSQGGKPRVIHVLHRGDVQKPRKEVTPGTVGALRELPSRFNLPANHTEGDRRAALARWLTHPQNPLTWRSAVNRIWQHHFGRGLVETPNDFGRMGALPTHPELLDWLAADFRDNGQSLKKTHKLIVTSATYRQSSASHSLGAKADEENRLLWRQNRRKLEAEAVRDSILSVSGRLDTKLGGPSYQDFVITHPEHSPHFEYDLHDPDDPRTHRRSIYRFIVRSQLQPMMTALDCADPSMQVDRRNQSVSAPQALALLNNGLTIVMSKHFAARLEREGKELPAQIRRGFELCFGRAPSDTEQQSLENYARLHGLINTCRVLLNLNEFTFVD